MSSRYADKLREKARQKQLVKQDEENKQVTRLSFSLSTPYPPPPPCPLCARNVCLVDENLTRFDRGYGREVVCGDFLAVARVSLARVTPVFLCGFFKLS